MRQIHHICCWLIEWQGMEHRAERSFMTSNFGPWDPYWKSPHNRNRGFSVLGIVWSARFQDSFIFPSVVSPVIQLPHPGTKYLFRYSKHWRDAKRVYSTNVNILTRSLKILIQKQFKTMVFSFGAVQVRWLVETGFRKEQATMHRGIWDWFLKDDHFHASLSKIFNLQIYAKSK